MPEAMGPPGGLSQLSHHTHLNHTHLFFPSTFNQFLLQRCSRSASVPPIVFLFFLCLKGDKHERRNKEVGGRKKRRRNAFPPIGRSYSMLSRPTSEATEKSNSHANTESPCVLNADQKKEREKKQPCITAPEQCRGGVGTRQITQM